MENIASSGGLTREKFKNLTFAEECRECELFVHNAKSLLQQRLCYFDTLFIEKHLPRSVLFSAELDPFSRGSVELITLVIHKELESSSPGIGFSVFYCGRIYAGNDRFPSECKENSVDKRAFSTEIGTENEVDPVMEIKILLLETAKIPKADLLKQHISRPFSHERGRKAFAL